MSADSATSEPIRELLRREVVEILRQFTLATSRSEIISAILRSLLNISSSTGGFYVYCPHGLSETAEIDLAVLGQNLVLQTLNMAAETPPGIVNVGQFRDWATSRGWIDLEKEHVIRSSNASENQPSIFCVPLRDHEKGVIGFLALENVQNPSAGSRLSGILFALAAANVRLNIARGTISSLGVIMHKIIHDLNGGLSVITLQTELMDASLQVSPDINEVRSRMESGLRKVDSATNLLVCLADVLFENQAADNQASARTALQLALVSLPIDLNLRAKVHVTGLEVDDKFVRGNGLLLYWLYRSVLAAWTNQDFWDPKDPTEMFVDLKYEDEQRRTIDLVLSRSSSSSLNRGLTDVIGKPHGYSKLGLEMMSPDTAMTFWCELFGGEFRLNADNDTWVLTISMPVA